MSGGGVGSACYAAHMSSNERRGLGSGPFRADQIRPGDPYELSDGHAILSPPTGQRGGKGNLLGGAVLESDPLVESAGVDVGVSPAPKQLRAPDVSVGNVGDAPGWASTAPPLAVEYAETGQDEGDLAVKIAELFAAGTRHVWVVRLTGPRRVEVHTPDAPVRVLSPGDELSAPGVLANPVPVEALYDRGAAHEATLRNLLQRQGYASLDAVRAEGREEGKEAALATLRRALLTALEARGLTPSTEEHAWIAACADLERLATWLTRAATAASVGNVVDR